MDFHDSDDSGFVDDSGFDDSGFIDSCVTIAAQKAASPVIATSVVSSRNVNTYPGAFSDFYGLPSNPVSVYKTGNAWPIRKGPEAQRVPREARPVCNHPIRDVWPKLGKQVYTFLDSLDVKWTTIDPVRFAEEGGEAGPLYLWVGVVPKSLSFKRAKAAADGCKKILTDAHFPDIEIAFRESIFTRSTGPRLLNHVLSVDPTADIRIPFTPALGVRIAPKDTPYFEGTGALYLRESSQTNRIFLLTARHVALPPSVHDNGLYEYKNSSTRRQAVLILGSEAYSDALEAMMIKIGREVIFADTYKGEIEALGEATEYENTSVADARQELQGKLAKAEKIIKDVNKFHSDITKHWSTFSERVVGHVVYAPPISVNTGPKQFTEDWALINLNRDKIDWNVFKGNVVSLGNIPAADFVIKMHPHPQSRSSFKYPVGGLLKVKGVVKEDEIRKPKQLDANGEECLIVIKNGKATGVAIGRGTGIESFIREYDDHGIRGTSMEVAIYSYSHKDGAFSAAGDSGSIVVDGQGRIVGMLTGGAGATESTDVTYLTPYFWLEERIKQAFPNSYLYPIAD